MILQHKTVGEYTSPTTARITTFEVTQRTRVIKDKEYTASEVRETSTEVAVNFDLTALFEISSDYALEGETQNAFFDRVRKDGIRLPVPIKNGAVHPDFVSAPKNK